MVYLYGDYNNLMTYLERLHKYVDHQTKRIAAMEAIIQRLQSEVTQLKQRPTTNIERIEYKFDQLKVETLEGTLNIGLTPNNGETIEDFSISQGNMNVPDVRQTFPILNDIENDVEEYLRNQCSEFIQRIENETNRSLDAQYREFIINDIRNQIPDRIHFYLQKNQGNIQNQEELHQVIVKKVKEDIQNSIRAFMKNMPNEMKGGPSN